VRVWLLPIEPFEDRYTEQWSRWWPTGLIAAGCKVDIVNGATTVAPARSSEDFLDPVETWRWKGEQVARLSRVWHLIEDGDWILTLDGWGPATEAAAYMRDATGKQVKLAAYFHAGSYDPNDFLARSGMRRWAMDVERGWMRACDLVLVGSQYHASMLRDELGLWPGEPPAVVVVGVPIKAAELREKKRPMQWEERPPLVVFPHRLVPEKRPEDFDLLRKVFAERHPKLKPIWVRTRDVCKTKDSYYEYLSRARCVFSSAVQETFGIAMQEGIVFGAWAVAPDRCSYSEVLRNGGDLYRTMEEAADLVALALSRTTPAPWDGHHERAVERTAQALLNPPTPEGQVEHPSGLPSSSTLWFGVEVEVPCRGKPSAYIGGPISDVNLDDLVRHVKRGVVEHVWFCEWVKESDLLPMLDALLCDTDVPVTIGVWWQNARRMSALRAQLPRPVTLVFRTPSMSPGVVQNGDWVTVGQNFDLLHLEARSDSPRNAPESYEGDRTGVMYEGGRDE
jgi:hypothetical protein